MTVYVGFDPNVIDEEVDYEYAVVFEYGDSEFPQVSYEVVIVTAPDYEATAWEVFYERHSLQQEQLDAKILCVQRLGVG
jgi:hypothetical protein